MIQPALLTRRRLTMSKFHPREKVASRSGVKWKIGFSAVTGCERRPDCTGRKRKRISAEPRQTTTVSETVISANTK